MPTYEVEFEFSSNGMSYSNQIEAADPQAAVDAVIAKMSGPKKANGLGSGIMEAGVWLNDDVGYVARTKIRI